MFDYFPYYLKVVGLLGLVVVNGLIPYVLAQSDPIGAILGGGMTIAGMGFLVWKLVTDHRIENRQREIYEDIIDTLQEERNALREILEKKKKRNDEDRD